MTELLQSFALESFCRTSGRRHALGGLRNQVRITLCVAVAIVALLAAPAHAQERTLFFGTEDAGVTKSIPTWGLDLAWLSADNVRRGVVFMGKDQTDVIRFSFTGDWAIVGGNLSPDAQGEFDQRMGIVNTYTNPGTPLYLNNDTDDWNTNPYLVSPNTDGVDAAKWAELIAVTAQKCVAAGHPVRAVSPFNEPDHAHWQGNVNRFGDVCWQLRWSGNFPAFAYGANPFIRIMGANTLNNQVARSWGYDQLNSNGFLEEGNTHQLAGDMPSYIDFYETVQANGDLGTNDELHNVMEAMVGAEYGMDGGIWWGPAELTRGEFVKASDGKRLAYAEHRPNWTAASVYRAPDNQVLGFVGESERQALPTTYRFLSLDRPVFYNGYGPQRSYSVTTTGGPGYQTAAHHNAEKLVRITWGDDVQPPIDGRYVIVAKHSGKVLDVSGASTAGGANIQQWTYTGGTNQQWDVHPVPSTTGGDYSYFTIRAAHSGQNIDLLNFSYADGGNLIQFGTGFSVNQQWFLEYAGDGYFYIRSKWSGKYVDVNGGVGATGDGANVQQYSGPGGANQLWRFMPVDANPADVTPPAAPSGLAAVGNEVCVSLSWNANAEGDIAGYNVYRSLTPGGPYETIARSVATPSYTDGSANQLIPYYYVVRAVDKALNRSPYSTQVSATPTGAPTLVARYAFDGTLSDSAGNGNDATTTGATVFSTARVGAASAAVFNANTYVNLPDSIASFDSITVAAWVFWNGGGAWQRIFDFGNGSSQYMFLTPGSGAGTLRLGINSGGGEQYIEAGAFPAGQWTHVAITLGGNSATIYVNGSPVATGPITLKPSDFNPVANSIGKSQFDGDPIFSGLVDEFQVYNSVISSNEIVVLANTFNPPDRPSIILTGSQKITTTKRRVVLRGTAKDATLVEYSTGKGGFKRLKSKRSGNDRSWKLRVRPVGKRTIVKIRASGPGGNSKILRVKILKQQSNP